MVVVEIRALVGKNTSGADDAVKDAVQYTAEADSGELVQPPESEEELEAVPENSEPESSEAENVENAEKPVFDEKAPGSEKARQQVENILQDAEGTWEVYISHENGDELIQKNAGENMRAGDIEYYFMAEQIYEMARAAEAGADEEYTADALLENPSSTSYNDLMDLIYECIDWNVEKKQPYRLKEGYPSTFWVTEDENLAGYTSAQNGAVLLENILAKAEGGDPYAEAEKTFIKKGWGSGKISSSLEIEGTKVYEVMSENTGNSRMEDFACIVLPDNTRYVIGIMVKNLENFTEAKEKIGEIATLSYNYYLGSE